MSPAFKTSRRVEFRDTDAARMAHFSVFFVWMEQTEHELLRHLGLSVMLTDEEGEISFPRVGARCDYQRSVKFEDVLDIEAVVVRLGEKSVTYEFNFSHEGRTRGQRPDDDRLLPVRRRGAARVDPDSRLDRAKVGGGDRRRVGAAAVCRGSLASGAAIALQSTAVVARLSRRSTVLKLLASHG